MRYSKNYQWVRLSHLGSGTSGKCHLAMDFTTEFKFCIKKVGISSCHSNIYFINMVIFIFDIMYQNLSVCEFESRSGRGVQHYVIKIVSDLRQGGDFLRVLRFPSPIKLTVTI